MNLINTSDNKLNTKELLDYMHEYAWEYGRIFNTELNEKQRDDRIRQKIVMPDEIILQIEQAVEFIKLKAIQDYMLSRALNDEVINAKIRDLLNSTIIK